MAWWRRRRADQRSDPRETDDTGRRFPAQAGVSFPEAPALIADPAAAARRALATSTPASGPVVVYFDVNMIDSGDLPLANYPHDGSGVRADPPFWVASTDSAWVC
jgi:hypothetical protein